MSSQAWNMSRQALTMSSQARNMSHQAGNMSSQARNMSSQAWNMSSQAGDMSSQASNPKDHNLKVSCHYLYFWPRYSIEKVCRRVVRVGGVVFVNVNDLTQSPVYQFGKETCMH